MAVSKLDVIHQHLVTAIQLMAIKASAISTHVVVKACEELIAGVAKSKGVLLDTDYRVLIRDEHHAEWRRKAVSSYNYFKHADRDPDADYDVVQLERLEEINELVMIANLAGFQKIGGSATAAPLLQYLILLTARHPDLYKLDLLHSIPQFRENHEQLRNMTETRLREMLLYSLHKAGVLPAIPPV